MGIVRELVDAPLEYIQALGQGRHAAHFGTSREHLLTLLN